MSQHHLLYVSRHQVERGQGEGLVVSDHTVSPRPVEALEGLGWFYPLVWPVPVLFTRDIGRRLGCNID